MKKILSLFLLFLAIQNSYGQLKTLTGYVSDKKTGEFLIGANVYFPNSKEGASTNKSGFFSVKVIAGKNKMEISYLGYQKRSFEFIAKNDTTFNIKLLPQATDLEEITVIEKSESDQQRSTIGLVNIPIGRLKTVPMLLGETDIIKALALTPGVSIGNEGTTGLLVRGGTPDQNLILLDDVPVYNVAHLFGFVSVFNADALKKVDLYKGGFPARFGGRLSSVIDISMKEGNNQELKAEIGVGIVGSRILIEGPLSEKLKGKTSFMFSGRVSYLSLLTIPNLLSFNAGKTDSYFNYWMYDFNGKINHKFKDNSQLIFSTYKGNDFWNAKEGNQKERSGFGLDWGNTTFSLRYNRILSKSLFSRSLITYSSYHYGLGTNSSSKVGNEFVEDNYFRNRSSVSDWGLKQFFEWFPNNQHQVRFGIDLTNHTFQPSGLQTNVPLNPDTLAKINRKIYANESAIYLEDEVQISSWLKANVGLRGVLYSVNNQSYQSLEPRVSVNILLPKYFALKAGYSQMKQFIHSLSGSGLGLPNDIWVPATQNVQPQRAVQYSVALTKTFPKINLELTVEAYQKNMSGLIDYKSGANFFASYNQSWENQIGRDGIGKVQGLEVFLNRTQGKFTWWIAYTLALNQRKFENINQGQWFWASYDRRHTLALTGNWKPNEDIDFSASWYFHSGQPTTIPVGIRQVEGRDVVVYIYDGQRNNFRMPSYQRLDLSVNFHHVTNRNRDATWSVGLYNVYNRINPYYLDFKKRLYYQDEKKLIGLKSVDSKLVSNGVFPVLPFLSYSIIF